MDHVGILKKGVAKVEDLQSGIKGIESRWSKRKIAPYGKVHAGDRVYFKYSTDRNITAVARVREVRQFELNPDNLAMILDEYGGEGKINLRNRNPRDPYYANKRYCTLIFLDRAEAIEPFQINRKGYGTAWFCVGDIDRVRVAA